jgi:hypothetical protein
LESTSPSNVTRWGTSIQITKAAVAGLSRVWDAGEVYRILTPDDRIKKALEALRAKEANKKAA